MATKAQIAQIVSMGIYEVRRKLLTCFDSSDNDDRQIIKIQIGDTQEVHKPHVFSIEADGEEFVITVSKPRKQ